MRTPIICREAPDPRPLQRTPFQSLNTKFFKTTPKIFSRQFYRLLPFLDDSGCGLGCARSRKRLEKQSTLEATPQALESQNTVKLLQPSFWICPSQRFFPETRDFQIPISSNNPLSKAELFLPQISLCIVYTQSFLISAYFRHFRLPQPRLFEQELDRMPIVDSTRKDDLFF